MALRICCSGKLCETIWWHCCGLVLLFLFFFFIIVAGNCAKEFGGVVAFLFWQIVGKNLVALLWRFVFCFGNLHQTIW